MLLRDVKRSLLKDLNITRLQKLIVNDVDIFDQKWKSCIDSSEKITTPTINGIRVSYNYIICFL